MEVLRQASTVTVSRHYYSCIVTSPMRAANDKDRLPVPRDRHHTHTHPHPKACSIYRQGANNALDRKEKEEGRA